MNPEFEPMEARLVEAAPDGPGWRYEPKWDGFRCLAYRQGEAVDLRAKSGKPLGRFFPEVVERLRGLGPDPFVVDGELVIRQGEALSFDALSQRLHPAESRIRKLAAETPAVLVLFDALLTPEEGALAGRPLRERRSALERLFAAFEGASGLALTPGTEDPMVADAWLAGTGTALDGIVAKRLNEPYRPGERAMLKVKRMRTADCVVGGYRLAQGGATLGSLLLGLYDDAGLLHHVGFTSSFTAGERRAVLERVQVLAEPPGFTGRAPDGPSRWSRERDATFVPLRPELVVEVRFDHADAERFRHGTKLLRWRPDKRPDQCRMDQLAPAAAPNVVRAALDRAA
jgi:ATP-dependent DNA ligase